MSRQIIYETDPVALFEKTADALFVGLERESGNSNLVLGLCGGRSVVGLLTAVRQWAVGNTLSELRRSLLGRLQFFMVDERLVPLNDKDSNYGMLKKQLLDELVESNVISDKQLHPFVPRSDMTDYGTLDYLHELQKYGGAFSAVVLGIGEDGHVAGLFPRHLVLQRSEPLFVSFFDSPKPPSGRMTATIPLIKTATTVILLATGAAKKNAWELFQEDSTALEDCPSVFTKDMSHLVIATDLDLSKTP